MRSMENPASPPESQRTCPTCNRPVEPGYKFCEACGTPIQDLPTCGRCGTRFISPVNFCESCGAPVNPGVEPEPDPSSGRGKEENVRTAEGHFPDREKKGIPGPERELPEPPVKNSKPGKALPLRRVSEEIQEPDTDALLEEFGADYDDKETLESSRKQKSGATDEALFLSPVNGGAPVRPRVNRTRVYGGIFILAVVIAGAFLIGLPVLAGNGGPGAHIDQPAPETTLAPTIAAATTLPSPGKTPVLTGALVPQATQTIPAGQKLYFQVQKNPVTEKISVIFAGSAGTGSIRSADIRVTHADGSVSTGIIQPLKGVNEISLPGSKNTDRVEIIAHMSSGETYRVYDSLVSS